MKILLQRVAKASVEVEGKTVGSIGRGILVFIGVTHTDTPDVAAFFANKAVNLRIFGDEKGKFHHSLLEEKGEILVISQFTLYADCTKGRRPSFIEAAPPEWAKNLYERFIEEVEKCGVKVQAGVFGAAMNVSLINDGPVTILLD